MPFVQTTFWSICLPYLNQRGPKSHLVNTKANKAKFSFSDVSVIGDEKEG